MGTLYLIATPIGNLDDLTYRAARTLGELDALFCEDTRHTRLIFDRYQLPRPAAIRSCHEHNERAAAGEMLELLRQDRKVGLCSNAGYPALSDPGYPAIARALEEGHRVEVIPGASAVPVALLLSGLPVSSFTFKGFAPRRPGRRRKWLEQERDLPHTLIFFESPQRLGAFLAEALEVYGDRRAAVCLELTKKFESCHRGPLSQLVAQFRDAPPKGEATVAIAGRHPKFAPDGPEDAGEGEDPEG